MTDRHLGYIVTLNRDIREDDAEPTIAAIRQIKNVLSVDPLIETGAAAYTGAIRERTRILKLVDKLYRDVSGRED